MESFVPSTVKQAKWLIAGGVFMLVIGVVRAAAFFNHGGLIYLVLALLFFSVGVASLVGSVTRIRRGDTQDERSADLP